ncbi:Neurogenic locus Notch protein-like 1 [Homarus americanus]|uniref:Neurogenic locus Notch protein-like 1 n=1 Tax=Homarus americanus TaxID=6706 RepID=A0A8J5N063_HOMAM|nr:Neurogenic locus Notch protein-like 1 [Homarus americanus]
MAGWTSTFTAQERVVSHGRVTAPSRISGPSSTFFSSRETFSSPCTPSPCGDNTYCEVSRTGYAQCRCVDGYVPDKNTIIGCKPQCVGDYECPDDFRCQGSKCVRVCVQGACGLNAHCEARNHQARCFCPTGYRGNAEHRCSQEEIEVRRIPAAEPVNPCDAYPCGVNTDCNERGGRAVCTCKIGYDGDPLTECRRGQCLENQDCPQNMLCRSLKCFDPCSDPRDYCAPNAVCTTTRHQVVCSCDRNYRGDGVNSCERFDPASLCSPSPCGGNTNCRVQNERAVCSCIDNYLGNPLTGCTPECVNPCIGLCGEGAHCNVRNGQALCSCPKFYQGDPYIRCSAECTAHDDCRPFQACAEYKCVNPCEEACGKGADCKVEDHTPICSCPSGYTGHPFEGCRPFTDDDYCNPDPCGSNANCQVGRNKIGEKVPVCTCPEYYIGNPLSACQLGSCRSNNDCPSTQACYKYECKNPCVSPAGSVCGINANCKVEKHVPICSCPEGYEGNPIQECSIPSRRRYVNRRRK